MLITCDMLSPMERMISRTVVVLQKMSSKARLLTDSLVLDELNGIQLVEQN